MNKHLLLFALFSLILLLPLYPHQAPFSKGVNLTNWFQASSATELVFGQIQISNQDKAMMTTSIAEPFPEGSLSIIPNPVKHQLQIISKWKDPVQFELWDALGRLLVEGEIHRRKRLNMQKLAPGIYLIKIRDRNRYRSIRRIWKE